MKLYYSESFDRFYTVYNDKIFVLDMHECELESEQWIWQNTEWPSIKNTTLNAKYIGSIDANMANN